MTGPSRRSVLAYSAAALAVAGFPRLASAGGVAHHHVDIKSFTFKPKTLKLRIGDTLTWTNRDLAPHTATASNDAWGTDALDKTQTETLTMTGEMAGEYFCAFHPHMKGQLIIFD